MAKPRTTKPNPIANVRKFLVTCKITVSNSKMSDDDIISDIKHCLPMTLNDFVEDFADADDDGQLANGVDDVVVVRINGVDHE